MDNDRDPKVEAEEAANAKEVNYWLEEIRLSDKREEDYRQVGKKVNDIYEACKGSEVPFNILYSNTEVLQPSLYSATPRPAVTRRHRSSDPLGAAGALVCQRTAEYLLDSNNAEYVPFDDLLERAVLEALLPGRGVTRFKYDAEMAPSSEENQPPTLKTEYVCGEVVPWDRYREGYARTWKEVPWVSYEHTMTAAELEENFGEIGRDVPVKATTDANQGDEEGTGNHGQTKTAPVYEIWDKVGKKVLFVSPSYPKKVLKKTDDPLKLSGFFPQPEPLCFTLKLSGRVPTSMYLWYETQAQELNDVTVRIKKIVNALKVRGFYSSQVENLEKLLDSDDNTLIAADNVAALGEGMGMDKAIWIMPIEKLVGVLQQLYVQREQCKAIIYEIMGISDIIRGNTQASETATAQDLKSRWGSLRLKRAQKKTEIYARNCLRIMLELACSKFSPETLQKMTDLPYPMLEEKQQAMMMVQQAEQQAMMMMQQPPMEGQPPQEPPPPDPMAVETSQKPAWEEIVQMLQDKLQRQYRIDIESNSTLMPDDIEDQEKISEFMNALSQFLNGVMPMMQEGYLPFEVMKTMLLATVRKFHFGREIEEQLQKMQAPQPKGDPKAEAEKIKQEAEAARMDAEGKREEAKFNMEMQSKQADTDRKEKLAMMEMQRKEREHQLEMEALERKAQLALATHNQKMQMMAAQAAMPQKTTTSPAGA